MRKLLAGLGVLAAVIVTAFTLAVSFGGPATPAPLASISDPFKAVDFSDQPRLETFLCRGGDTLAFREYKPSGQPAGTVVLVHGSSGSSTSMHPMAKAFAKAGYQTYAVDMRGHGGSGERGRVKFVGHLEFDIEDFVKAAKIGPDAILAGFSSGGGFVLRFAASERQDLFGSYLLLSPFISERAANYRPDGGGWVSVGIPRIVALSIANGFGVTAYNDLPVIRFAVTEEGRKTLTPEYSFGLAANFRPPRDYAAAIRAVRQPIEVIVGKDDELFFADRTAAVFEAAGRKVPVTIVPGTSHIGLILEPQAIKAAVEAAARLRRANPA